VRAATASPSAAGDRYAVVISGASGGDVYAQKYDAWRTSFVAVLRDKLGYPADHVFVLAEKEDTGTPKANPRRRSPRVRRRCARASRKTTSCSCCSSAMARPTADEAKFKPRRSRLERERMGPI